MPMLIRPDHASTSQENLLTSSKCGKFAITGDHTPQLTMAKCFYDPLLPLITRLLHHSHLKRSTRSAENTILILQEQRREDILRSPERQSCGA
jgi:hypothetical protein